jgi:membrane associated rhomboid family serine protease
MREPGEMVSAAFPRPGRALKAVLIALGVFAIVGALLWNWTPNPAAAGFFHWVALEPRPLAGLLYKPWTLVTSGLLTWPVGISHALWSIVGLYFLGTDLEKRWGGARLLRFLAISVVMGNGMVLLVDQLPFASHRSEFHPTFVVGPLAAITATAIAWATIHAKRQVRLFFVFPVSGRALFWFTILGATLSPLFMQGAPEGTAAPFGGILAGVIMGGSPSPVRTFWLRLRLAFLRRKGSVLTAESLLTDSYGGAPKRTPKGTPVLRVVRGGVDDDLKGRKPPKDKRYLN